MYFLFKVPKCPLPLLTLTPFSEQSNPNRIYRSKLFSLSTSIYFACNTSSTYEYTWTLTLVDSGQNIDLTANPTYLSSELVIQSNTLTYGVYQFNVQVNVITSQYGTFTNTNQTFIQILPTGLAVFAIANGIESQLIGSSQPFVLNPVGFSFDMDNLVAPSNLVFDFYCQTISLTQSSSSSSQIRSSSLKAYLTNSSLTLAWNTTCFDTLSNSLFRVITFKTIKFSIVNQMKFKAIFRLIQL